MTGHGGWLLVIACGALAREINWLRVNHNWRHVEVTCLDAALHNRPESIPDAVDNLIQQYQPHYDQLFVAYGDCGTGGRLDAVLPAIEDAFWRPMITPTARDQAA